MNGFIRWTHFIVWWYGLNIHNYKDPKELFTAINKKITDIQEDGRRHENRFKLYR